MGWFLRIGNWTVAKMIQFLYGGPSLSDCGCTLRLTHRVALDRIGQQQRGRVHPEDHGERNQVIGIYPTIAALDAA